LGSFLTRQVGHALGDGSGYHRRFCGKLTGAQHQPRQRRAGGRDA
jgi:hypothetical protein